MQVHVGQQRRYDRSLRCPYLTLRPVTVFRYSGCQPLTDQPQYAVVGHSMLKELHGPFVTHVIEEATYVRIQYPVHRLPFDAHIERVQRPMRAASRSKPVRKAAKVHLVYLVEDGYHCLLDDLVFQRRNAQWTLPPIGFRYIHSSRWLRPVRSPVHPAVEVA